MASPELQTLGVFSMVIVAAERMVALFKDLQTRRNGGGVTKLLHDIKEAQIEQTVILRQSRICPFDKDRPPSR